MASATSTVQADRAIRIIGRLGNAALILANRAGSPCSETFASIRQHRLEAAVERWRQTDSLEEKATTRHPNPSRKVEHRNKLSGSSSTRTTSGRTQHAPPNRSPILIRFDQVFQATPILIKEERLELHPTTVQPPFQWLFKAAWTSCKTLTWSSERAPIGPWLDSQFGPASKVITPPLDITFWAQSVQCSAGYRTSRSDQ